MPTPKVLEIKRGATLSRAQLLPADALYEGGTWIAKCQAVGKLSEERVTLTAALLPPVAPNTQYTLHLFAPASATALWNVEKYECDVDLIDTSADPEPFVIPSATFLIDVKKDVTE